MTAFRSQLQERVSRQREFHRRKDPGDLLVYVNRDRYASLEAFLCDRLFSGPVEQCLRPDSVRTFVREYVQQLRGSYPGLYAIEDDSVPCAIVYWGIGGITAAMTGLEPHHAETTSWLEPGLSWDRIRQLRFDPANRWVRFAAEVNTVLWSCWEEDFLVLPFLHRSPLDAANGIRGSDLFLEMYTDPERVHALVNWCADWSIAVEELLDREVGRPHGWGNGIWSTWLPDRAVFVNGDPVCMISPDMQAEFDRPATARLFRAGGGFFHSHTAGLYQVANVARTPGLLVQEFITDPKCPTTTDVLLGNPRVRDEVLTASLRAPIMIENVAPDRLDALLPIVHEGRFILSLSSPEGVEAEELVRKVRMVSGLR